MSELQPERALESAPDVTPPGALRADALAPLARALPAIADAGPQQRPGHVCTPIERDELGSKFPALLGFTDPWQPRGITLVSEDGTLQLSTTEQFEPANCRSYVIKAGKHPIGKAIRIAGEWDPDFKKYFGRRVTWIPKEPSENGTYTLALDVSLAAFNTLCEFEWEHVQDHAYAWDKSYKAVEALLAGCAAATDIEALELLQTKLNDIGAAYLIPATPADVGAWGPRIKDVFQQLAGQSAKRDRPGGPHLPAGYTFTVAGQQITMSHIFRDHQSSDELITVGEVTLAAAVVLGYEQGDLVTWKVPRETLLNKRLLFSGEKKIHQRPEIDPNAKENEINVLWVVHDSGATVERIDDGWTWLRADFNDDVDDPSAVSYARIASERLKKKT